jgi:hypothetical protein
MNHNEEEFRAAAEELDRAERTQGILEARFNRWPLRHLWRAVSYRFGWYRLPERAQMAVAWHAPRWLVYQCVNRAIAHATTGKLAYQDQHVPTVLAIEVFKSWNDPRGGDRWAKRYNERETKKLWRLINRAKGRS